MILRTAQALGPELAQKVGSTCIPWPPSRCSLYTWSPREGLLKRRHYFSAETQHQKRPKSLLPRTSPFSGAPSIWRVFKHGVPQNRRQCSIRGSQRLFSTFTTQLHVGVSKSQGPQSPNTDPKRGRAVFTRTPKEWTPNLCKQPMILILEPKVRK